YVCFNPFPYSKQAMPLTFYVFDFHDFFDGLIGYEALRLLNADLMISRNVLQLPDVEVPMLKKYPTGSKFYLNCLETKVVKIP
ncbi:unnamed protein product, partial [Sphagnum compactum]